MIKRKGKLKSRKGFSLTELLVAVLILSMVSAVVAGGIPVARDAYNKVTLSANAQVLLSTTISALRNELCTASEVECSDSTKIDYYSASISNYSRINSTDDGIILYRYTKLSTPSSMDLVSEKTGDDQLHAIYSSVSYADGIVEFTGLRVVDEDNNVLAKLQEVTEGEPETSILKIRVITA